MALLRYSTLRFLLLLAAGAVLYAVGLRGLPLLLLALLVSGIASLFLLDRQRDDLGSSVGGWFSRINARIDASARAEDDDPRTQA